MIDLGKYGIEQHEVAITTNDLIALANIQKGMVDTVVVSDNGVDTLIIKGEYEASVLKSQYAVAGGEIVKIESSEKSTGNTVLKVKRAQKGTIIEDTSKYHFRTVILIDENTDGIELLDFDFNDTTGDVKSSLFPVELGTGSISIKSNLEWWTPYSLNKRFDVIRRRSVAYIFKGVDNKRFLKHTCLIANLSYNTRGQKDINKIKFNLKSKLYKWYDKDMEINAQLKGTTPKDFFKLIFGLEDHEVYYANGVDPTGFLPLYNLHTKEYKSVSEMLKAFCSNGVRFSFDAKERVKIFGDFKVKNIQSQKTIQYNLTNSMLSENDQMIYNTISTQSTQRQTMYNFSDLDNKYVMFAKKKANAIMSNTLISLQDNGDLLANGITIKDKELHSSVQLDDYVLFKTTTAPIIEVYGCVKGLDKDYSVYIQIIIGADKDYKLFPYGKNTYLYNILNNNIAPMDLYYVRQALPIIWKFSRNKGGTEKDSSLLYPILPRVDGETKYPVEVLATFGAPKNLKIGKYANIVEEISKIYGLWTSDNLLYNREHTQFDNNGYPPIFALTNKITERKIGESTIINYTSFDNSDFLLEIRQPTDNKGDAVINMGNTQTINSGIDLYTDTELGRPGRANNVLQVSDITAYKIGDVLIVNKPDDLSDQEELEYDEVLSGIRWVVTQKDTQVGTDGQTKHYIILDSPFAKRHMEGKKYSFTRFPNWSIVYVQELYFRGNPVIEFTQDIYGTSKTVTPTGDTSKEVYGEKKYSLESKLLDKLSLRKMMGYILSNFQATSIQTTKFLLPVTVFNGIDIELFDVVTVLDPNFTGSDEKIKWIVVGITTKNGTNQVELKLLNANQNDTEPYKIDIKDVIDYEPVIVPDYDHTGNEGNGGVNDGGSGEDTDDALGMIALSEVDPKKFRARIERIDNQYIYFKDFNGTEYEEYQKNLFPVSEFAINVGGEVIFVQSDQKYRAYIKRRNLYGTVDTVVPLQPEADVTFLILSTITGLDGTFYARKAHLGDAKSYLHVDPLTGVSIVGDFRVGENGKNPDNDLWNAMQNNRVFRQPAEPVSTATYTLKQGDVWYDTDDNNKVYIFESGKWVDTQDKNITQALGNAKIFWQPNEPTANMKENDLWYDTDDQNHPYIYKNGKWESARDKIFETEGGNKVYFQPKAPTIGDGYPLKEGDMWFDTGNNNIMYVLMKLPNGNLNWQMADDSLNKINTGRIILNGNTTVNGDFRVRNGNVELGGDTKVYGILSVFGGSYGIASYNGTSEATSNQRTLVLGGKILLQEKV